MEAGFSTEIYDSIKQVDPEEWYSLIDAHLDLAMDQRLIHLLERSLSGQARFWTVLVRDRQKQLIACACLSLFQTDIVQSVSGFLQTMIQRLRQKWPNVLKLKVLFCGLPLPSAHSHFRVREAIDLQPILKILNKTMTVIARGEKASLLVLKELDAIQDKQLDSIRELGFVRGELEPLYQLTGNFKDFNDYCAALRSPYRHQIQTNVKRFNKSGLKVEHFFDSEEIYSRFNGAVHRLYLNVWEKAKEKLECFSLDFFREIARSLPGQVAFTLISDNQKPVAFVIGIIGSDTYYNSYVGIDYDYNDTADLYFNLFYRELDVVFRFNKQKISLGQTSGMFKSRLGAVPSARFFWVRPLNPVLGIIFKCFQSIIFPRINPIKQNQVFKTL